MIVNVTEMMRRDWDERARRDAFHYIASWKQDWNIDSFLASGEKDYATLVSPVLERCGIPASGEVMVELGCGAGRMTPSFGRRYKRIVALDLSAEMLQRARQIHVEQQNILWLRVGGANLACLKDGSADFIFSYLVLQHLPTAELAFGYIREFLRVLRPGGAFLFQFNGGYKPTMNLRGRLAWGAVDALWSARLVSLSKGAARLLGLDPAAAGKSWRGAAIEAARIVSSLRSSGGEICELSGEHTPMAWCCGVKKTSA
jgi:ubiquinone/menaquinone biosynthesis C-methylase UbiE